MRKPPKDKNIPALYKITSMPYETTHARSAPRPLGCPVSDVGTACPPSGITTPLPPSFLPARDPLHHYPRILINQNTHRSLFFPSSPTTAGRLLVTHGRYGVKSPLRASNEGLLRPRVARAQGLGPVPPSSPTPPCPSASQFFAPLPTNRSPPQV
jgi:hypothetical protein